jgi:integrase
MRINFTVKTLDGITPPVKGRDTYQDEQVKGLSLRVTSNGVMSFIVRKRITGQMNATYTTLGHYPAMTIGQARSKARGAVNVISDGVSPKKLKDSNLSKQTITLKIVFNNYVRSRGTNLQESTIKGYKGIVESYLKDWVNKPISEITRDMVEKRHRDITYGTGKYDKSPSRANTCMRIVRALFNYAMGQYEDSRGEPIFYHNPVARISHNKAWNREPVRQGIVKNYELKKWYEGVMTLPEHDKNKKKSNSSEVARDLFIFILFSGLRRNEALTLKWEDIDFKYDSFTIEDTKNHETHSLPLTSVLLEVLDRRKNDTDNPYVFEGEKPNSHLTTPKKQIEKARELAGVHFTFHDLRRTFETTAESLSLPPYTLKKLINHKDSRDVTGRYIIIQMERLREPMKQITDELLSHMK